MSKNKGGHYLPSSSRCILPLILEVINGWGVTVNLPDIQPIKIR